MPRAAPLSPEDRRAQLLRCARAVFAERGYHAASISQIIAAAGVARGTFYNYFESKRAVFQAVLDGVMDSIDAAVTPIDIARPVPPQVRLILSGIAGALAGDASWFLLAEAVGMDAEGDQTLRDFYGRALERIERALRTGQAMGIVRDGDLQLMARCLMGLVKEPVFQAWLHGEPLDTDALTDELFALLMGGVLR